MVFAERKGRWPRRLWCTPCASRRPSRRFARRDTTTLVALAGRQRRITDLDLGHFLRLSPPQAVDLSFRYRRFEMCALSVHDHDAKVALQHRDSYVVPRAGADHLRGDGVPILQAATARTSRSLAPRRGTPTFVRRAHA
jgi:hypothetical protein